MGQARTQVRHALMLACPGYLEQYVTFGHRWPKVAMFLRGTFVMANDTKTHDALVADWKANAKIHDEKNY